MSIENSTLGSITTNVSLTGKQLIEEYGTIPFCGLHNLEEYPEEVSANGRKYVSENDDNGLAFVDAIQILPEAQKVDVYADNVFCYESPDGIEINESMMRSVDGVDVEAIEDAEGLSLTDLVDTAGKRNFLEIPKRKAVIDPRRLLLRNLGIPSVKNRGDIKFFWQIASDQYSPLQVRRFLKRKAEVCSQHETEDAFGWIRHRDWGGSVTITTIYPSKSYVVSPSDSDSQTDEDEDDNQEVDESEEPSRRNRTENLTKIEPDNEHADTEVTEDITVYYGDRMRYNFKGTKRLDVTPVIYFPSKGVMIPVQDRDKKLSRKHSGSLMKDVMSYHEEVLETITEMAESINEDIKRARQYAIDFSSYDIEIEDFYRHLGIQNDTYTEAAADKARRFSNVSSKPTIWNLHLSLKTALLENCSSKMAGETYQAYQEIAGQLLQQPALKLSIALSEHERQKQKEQADSPEELRDEDQISITESFDEILQHGAVTESDLSLKESEEYQEQIDRRIENIGGDDE